MTTLYPSKKLYVASAVILSLSVANASETTTEEGQEQSPQVTPSVRVDLTGEEPIETVIAIPATKSASQTLTEQTNTTASVSSFRWWNPLSWGGGNSSVVATVQVPEENPSVQDTNSTVPESPVQAQTSELIKARHLKELLANKSLEKVKAELDNLDDSVVITPATFSTKNDNNIVPEVVQEDQVPLPASAASGQLDTMPVVEEDRASPAVSTTAGQPETMPDGFEEIAQKERETIFAILSEILKSGKGNLENAKILNKKTYLVVNYNPQLGILSQKIMSGRSARKYRNNLQNKYNRGQHGYNHIQEIKQ